MTSKNEKESHHYQGPLLLIFEKFQAISQSDHISFECGNIFCSNLEWNRIINLKIQKCFFFLLEDRGPGGMCRSILFSIRNRLAWSFLPLSQNIILFFVICKYDFVPLKFCIIINMFNASIARISYNFSFALPLKYFGV